MADYYATLITGIDAAYLTDAAISDAHAGQVLPLAELETDEQWARQTRSVGAQNRAYGVAASAVATIEQIGGAGASMRLLRAHRRGLDQFSASLQQVTGLDLAGPQRRLLDRLLRI